jgi:serine/threonine protein kinase/N-acetylneuraminic acid mutarotase
VSYDRSIGWIGVYREVSMAASNLIGRTIGQYRVVEQLGMGGMATVYKAYHPAMDRYVALKIPPEYLARDPNFRARFIREARTLAHLEHPHILPVYDFGEEDGLPYFVMRYVDGGTLRELMTRGPLPLDQALRLVREVAEALGYAHTYVDPNSGRLEPIVHRDVKPANVLLDRNGTALLTDFGIAKILDENTELTGTGVALGTPQYMAPEQVQGKPVDARTDIYSLGVVLYEVATGRRPFAAETPLALAMMHVNEALPLPRQVNPAVPEAVERIILRAMAKNPDDRFQTADEFAAALGDRLNEAPKSFDLTSTIPVRMDPNDRQTPVAVEDRTVLQGTSVVSLPAEAPAPPSPAELPAGPPPIGPPTPAPLADSPAPARSGPAVSLPRPPVLLGIGGVVVVALVALVLLAPGLTGRANPGLTGSPTPTAVATSGAKAGVVTASAQPSPTSPPASPVASPTSSTTGANASPATWTERQALPRSAYALAAATGSDGRTYAIGGYRGAFLKSVDAYTPGTNRWTPVASMATARDGLAAVSGPDGRIYAIGGYNAGALNTVEAYTPSTNSWAAVASLPTARHLLAAVAGPDGRIYAIGGNNGTAAVNTVEAYTPSSNTWTTVASMPTARANLAAAVGADGRIYAIGGERPSAVKTVEAYTPSTNTWTTVATMPTARGGLATLTGADGRIYALGGTNGKYLTTVEAYTPSTNTWTTVASMPTARSALAAALGPDERIYAIGGRDTSGDLAIVEAYGPATNGSSSAAGSSPTPTPY